MYEFCDPPRYADVTGIHGSREDRLPIGSAASVTHDVDGKPILLLMHQYAQSSSQSQLSIHSVPQLESYGNHIDAKSRVNGGHQLWTTSCGRKIPINIRSGLPKIDTRRATEADFDNPDIAHFHITK